MAAALTAAAIVTSITGHHVATPWLLVGALTFVLFSALVAYARAASARDRLQVEVARKHDYISREEHEASRMVGIDQGDGTIWLGTVAEARAEGREISD